MFSEQKWAEKNSFEHTDAVVGFFTKNLVSRNVILWAEMSLNNHLVSRNEQKCHLVSRNVILTIIHWLKQQKIWTGGSGGGVDLFFFLFIRPVTARKMPAAIAFAYSKMSLNNINNHNNYIKSFQTVLIELIINNLKILGKYL